MATESVSRTEEITQIHREYRNFYRLLGGGALVMLGVIIGAVLFSGNAPAIDDISGYFTNLYTEAVSVILTIFVLNYLQEQREERQRIRDVEQKQTQLILDATSSVNNVAKNAIDELRKRNWLGTYVTLMGGGYRHSLLACLRGVRFSKSDLRDAYLETTDLRKTRFSKCNLSGANLITVRWQNSLISKSNLSNSHLIRANLKDARFSICNFQHSLFTAASAQNASFWGGDFTGADLSRSNFANANLRRTKLNGVQLIRTNLTAVDLHKADLTDALIQDTDFDTNTILPDGSNWSPERNLAEFGAETREIISRNSQRDEGSVQKIQIYTFADGITRRWQLGKGWLDDKDGNPIGED